MAINQVVEPRALLQLRAARQRRDKETRGLIRQAVGEGIRSQDIADALGVSRSTLWRHYSDELRDDQPRR